MCRLNERTKDATDSYPADAATRLSLSSLETNRSAATLIRRRVRYWRGGSPTSSLNLAAKPDRETPRRRAREETVQGSSGPAWSHARTWPICSSRTAASQPALAESAFSSKYARTAWMKRTSASLVTTNSQSPANTLSTRRTGT